MRRYTISVSVIAVILIGGTIWYQTHLPDRKTVSPVSTPQVSVPATAQTPKAATPPQTTPPKKTIALATTPKTTSVQTTTSPKISVQVTAPQIATAQPTVVNTDAKVPPVKVKGIYMTGWVAGIPRLRDKLISLIDRTELNAVVLDVKDDDGQLTSDSLGIPLAKSIGAPFYKAKLPQVLDIFKKHNIYPIARIVCFKDGILPVKRPDLAVKTASGRLWRDRKGLPWVDPYNHEVWKYNVDVAIAAAKLGFKEIQFDYVRFVSDGNMNSAVYPAKNASKEDNIKNFLTYAKNRLAPYHVYLAADVFGLTTTVTDDMRIGQKFEKVSSVVDYICPMAYPSHYALGTYGLKNPNANPFETVFHSMQGAIKKTSGAIIRTWIQDFTLGKPKYTATEVIAEKQAVYKAGLDQWILWNANNHYTEDALVHTTDRT